LKASLAAVLRLIPSSVVVSLNEEKWRIEGYAGGEVRREYE
jgi:hypothetical protein